MYIWYIPLYFDICVMSLVQEKHGWFLINDSMLFGVDTKVPGIISLAATQWDAMVYTKSGDITIDYPGEYDIQGVFIKVLSDKNKMLHYIIHDKNEIIALVQSPRILEEDDFADVQTILYTDPKVAQKIEQLELEVEKIQLVPTTSV